MSATDATAERQRRAAAGLRLYLVFMDPVEGSGDRSAARSAHFAFMQQLAETGALIAGGPLIDEESGKTLGRGLTVLRASSLEAAEAMIKDDPFVVGGFRRYTIEPWRVNEGRLPAELNLASG